MVTGMTVVRCPICSEEVAGAGKEGLTSNLRAHLTSEHEVDNQLEAEKNRPYLGTRDDFTRPSDDCSEHQYIGICLNKDVYADQEQFVGRSDWNAQSSRAPERQYIGTSGDFDSQSGRGNIKQYVGARDDFSRPDDACQEKQFLGTCSATPGEAPAVKCPVCGQQLTGVSDQELSDNLCGHFEAKHIVR